MAFIDEIGKVLSTAKSLLPLVAIANPQAASGIASVEAIMAVVKPLVDEIDAIATQKPMSGPEKLAMAQNAIQSSIALAQKAGVTSATFDQYWTFVEPAITAICAAKKTTA